MICEPPEQYARESGEELEPVLVQGAVIAYEPGFTWHGESFYLEDMILIHQDHAEILSIGLPTSADEIESFMAEGGLSNTDH